MFKFLSLLKEGSFLKCNFVNKGCLCKQLKSLNFIPKSSRKYASSTIDLQVLYKHLQYFTKHKKNRTSTVHCTFYACTVYIFCTRAWTRSTVVSKPYNLQDTSSIHIKEQCLSQQSRPRASVFCVMRHFLPTRMH